MNESKYTVMIGNDIAAENMNLSTAMLLAKSIFEDCYLEPNLSVTIVRMDEEDKDTLEYKQIKMDFM